MIVQVKDVAIRHNGTKYNTGEEFQIERAQYERIKAHVNVIDENESPKPVEKNDGS